MTTRGRRRFLNSAKYFPANSPTKKCFADASSLAATLPHKKTSSLAELKSEMLASLQVLKKDMDHEHVFMVKATEAHTAKLKKRVKQECQEASQLSRAIDTDWKNFLADFDEDARENQEAASHSFPRSQESIETLLRKSQKAAAYFTESCIPELLKTVETKLNDLKSRCSRPVKARRLSMREKGKTIDD